MATNDKKKKRIVAIARQLKDKKGLTIKQNELNQDLTRFKTAQKEILKVKEEYKGVEIVEKEADAKYKKLQSIIDELNEYMSILHPEGIIDYGSGASGKKIVGQG